MCIRDRSRLMAIRKRASHSAIDMRDQRDEAVILWDVQAVDVLDEPVERPTMLIEDSVQLYLREIGSVALLTSEMCIRDRPNIAFLHKIHKRKWAIRIFLCNTHN